MDSTEIVSHVPLFKLGAIANEVARRSVLSLYKETKSAETLRRQSRDIASFEEYLDAVQHHTENMIGDLSLWEGMTYGIVSAFQRWLLLQGYSIGTVNVRMATIKSYCDLATQAGYITGDDMAVVRGIRGYNRKAGRNIDEKRATQRRGRKKAQTVLLSDGHVELLKRKLYEMSPTDMTAARDYLLFCLFVDLGLRCGEVAELETRNIDTLTGTLIFYRRKVDKTQTHNLKGDTLEAAKRYLRLAPSGHKLFTGYAYKDHKKASDGLSTRALNKIISRLGAMIEVAGLSPHDLRHYWSTLAIRKGTNIKALQQAGGWNSPTMPLKYAEESKIANEGVKLS
jgi:integrase